MNIKKLERKVAKNLISITYSISSILPVKDCVTFATFRTLELGGNFKFIKEEIENQNLNLPFYYLFKKFKPSFLGKVDYMLHMIYVGYKMATSKFFIIDDYYFPVYAIKPRKNTSIIQVWHACGAFKKFGYDVLEKGYGADNEYVKDIKIHTNYDVVLVSSNEVAKHYASAFNMNTTNIYPTGIPRTDVFYDHEIIAKAKEKVYQEFPILQGKKVILYAPTVRGNGQTDMTFTHSLDYDYISHNLQENTLFALKMHPFVKVRLEKEYDNIVDLSDYKDINDLMMVSDMLVSDYSSVIFEYSIMEKPIIMYAPDKEEYIKERDFYYEYDSFVPGPIVTTTSELVSMLPIDSFDTLKVKIFKEKFFEYHDGKSSQRFVNQFIKSKLK